MKFCVYCGDWYECRDHVIPVSYNKIARDYRLNQTVPACKECNGYLGAKAYHTIIDRAAYLLERYPYKYRKLLKIPHWTKREVSELGYNLRTGLKEKLSLRETYDWKIQNLERVSQGLPSRPFNYRGKEVFEAWEHFEVGLDVPEPEEQSRECEWCECAFLVTTVKYRCCSVRCYASYKRWRNSRRLPPPLVHDIEIVELNTQKH